MARNAASLIDALGLERVDLFGFSMGGYVAQQIAVDRPELVRRLILVGTGPRGGEGMDQLDPDVAPLFAARIDPRISCGCRSSSRARTQPGRGSPLPRRDGHGPRTETSRSRATITAHSAAARDGERRHGSFDYLNGIAQPTLVVNGSNDIVVPTINSYILQQNCPTPS